MALPQRYTEKDCYTEDEYLRWEEDALYKSEYVRGEICAMSGGTDDRGTIGMSVGSALVVALRGRGCRVMSSDVKVRTTDGVFATRTCRLRAALGSIMGGAPEVSPIRCWSWSSLGQYTGDRPGRKAMGVPDDPDAD